jgi:hypothetical protein
MLTYDRRRWQAAVRITAALQTSDADPTHVHLPAATWENLFQLSRRHQRALDRG